MKYINMEEDKGKEIFHFVLFEYEDQWVKVALEKKCKPGCTKFFIIFSISSTIK